ncbi:glycosyltransferase family 2 protein [Phenylobacterium kunshanense]|uniref:Uncharacterized protein n=1 Tax=Phenylobacterium kunshanense TaxID=1445034 RepID=A0A328BRU3_9CAUL|nr:glycosyltransferase family 2 protein [Phenylobacterium kunshanense]RAK67788.1 hypothetical protein DJ019_07770 [Phenylobacterium kunshanense]
MSSLPNDTFFYLLDHPHDRRYELLGRNIPYRTPRFSRDVYEESRGRSFASLDEAYLDWVEHGRAAGLAYAPGRDTTLKIVLKVKDEPDLLERWITYHAAMVGLENLVVVDCGSVDPAHWAILDRYQHDMLVLRYPDYYDLLHAVGRNKPLYYWLARNAKFVTVMDADEFLFGYDGKTISPHHVVPVLRTGGEAVHAPTWISNAAAPEMSGGRIDWDRPIAFALDAESLWSGTVAGKSIVRTDALFEAAYVGHNLHVGRVVSRMTEGSFGKFFQFHLSALSPEISRRRIAKHLRAKGFLPAKVEGEAAVSEFLLQLLRADGADPTAAYYAERYLEPPTGSPGGEPQFSSRLLAGVDHEASQAFTSAIDAFDFRRVWTETKPRI